MAFNPQIHRRRSIRLKGYDYAQNGLYFITICVQEKLQLFGKVQNGEMMLNPAGKMIEKTWLEMPDKFPEIQLHEFIVMPNHFHAIIEIVGAPLVGALAQPCETVEIQGKRQQNIIHHHLPIEDGTLPNRAPTRGAPTVGDITGIYKSITTRKYAVGVKSDGWPEFAGKLWQRNFWEHIIKDASAYDNIAAYINNNPASWSSDKLNS